MVKTTLPDRATERQAPELELTDPPLPSEPDWLELPTSGAHASFFRAGDALESELNRGLLDGPEALEAARQFGYAHGHQELLAVLRRVDSLPPVLNTLLARMTGVDEELAA